MGVWAEVASRRLRPDGCGWTVVVGRLRPCGCGWTAAVGRLRSRGVAWTTDVTDAWWQQSVLSVCIHDAFVLHNYFCLGGVFDVGGEQHQHEHADQADIHGSGPR
eukprot:360759-Chlamydomonas_euryale.AAC.2